MLWILHELEDNENAENIYRTVYRYGNCPILFYK